MGLGVVIAVVEVVWVWPRVMKRENLGEERRMGVCNGREERERGREAVEERERKREK
jgi:hypothetical protein